MIDPKEVAGKWLGVGEVAELLGKGEQTVMNYVTWGYLDKVGKRGAWFITGNSVLDHMEGKRTPNAKGKEAKKQAEAYFAGLTKKNVKPATKGATTPLLLNKSGKELLVLFPTLLEFEAGIADIHGSVRTKIKGRYDKARKRQAKVEAETHITVPKA